MKKFGFRTAAAACAAAFVLSALPVNAMAEAAETVTEAQTESEVQFELTGNENILLIGSDIRDTSWNGNSDTMILMTINHDVDKIFLTSFMRDLWADIPGVGVRKLNNAYAVGGAKLLEDTLTSCYGVHIDHYAAVDFEGIEDIIDALGGVDIELSDAEAKVSNDYVKALCNARGLDPEASYLTGGMHHLNGIQALGYMRNRYVGNNDFERTERQRRVLKSLADNFDFTDLENLKDLKDQIMDYMDTDLNTLSIAMLMAEVPTIRGYELVSNRIPYDDMYHSENEILVPDLAPTVERLTDLIYATGEEEAESEQ